MGLSRSPSCMKRNLKSYQIWSVTKRNHLLLVLENFLKYVSGILLALLGKKHAHLKELGRLKYVDFEQFLLLILICPDVHLTEYSHCSPSHGTHIRMHVYEKPTDPTKRKLWP